MAKKGPKPRTDRDLRRILESQPRNPETGCWEWSRSLSTGYGVLTESYGPEKRAHRIAYRVFKGPIGDLCVLHRCDNRRCVNPAHLFLGTLADNMADMYAKGRQSPAAQRRTFGHRKLTEDQVHEIDGLYADGWSQQRIAERFGLNQTAVSKVLRRESWSHVRKS